jgi:hypothetical protein
MAARPACESRTRSGIPGGRDGRTGTEAPGTPACGRVRATRGAAAAGRRLGRLALRRRPVKEAATIRRRRPAHANRRRAHARPAVPAREAARRAARRAQRADERPHGLRAALPARLARGRPRRHVSAQEADLRVGAGVRARGVTGAGRPKRTLALASATLREAVPTWPMTAGVDGKKTTVPASPAARPRPRSPASRRGSTARPRACGSAAGSRSCWCRPALLGLRGRGGPERLAWHRHGRGRRPARRLRRHRLAALTGSGLAVFSL